METDNYFCRNNIVWTLSERWLVSDSKTCARLKLPELVLRKSIAIARQEKIVLIKRGKYKVALIHRCS